MRIITHNSIGEAHSDIIRLINKDHKKRKTEDNEETYDLYEPLCVHINFPLSEPMMASASQYGSGFSEVYKSSFYKITPRKGDNTDATYTYGNRLRDYPTPYLRYKVNYGNKSLIRRIINLIMIHFGYVHNDVTGIIDYHGDGWGHGIDQISESIIARLIENPNTRRAEAITWFPPFDIYSKEPPCAQIIWCNIDPDYHVNLVALFRSNDMLSAWGQNAIGLANLQKYIIDNINEGLTKKTCTDRKIPGVTMGWLETISLSPHIYYIRDQVELNAFLKRK